MNIAYKPELYKKTVDILFDAYFNDTLEHQNCQACAVGNIVAANMGIKLISGWHEKGFMMNVYPIDFITNRKGSGDWFGYVSGCSSEITDKGIRQIKATGYSKEQLYEIESAFENVTGGNKEDYMFNGLVAVLEILKQIHQVTDDKETLPRFQKHYETKSFSK